MPIINTQDKDGSPILLAVLKGQEKQTAVEALKRVRSDCEIGLRSFCDRYEGFINAVEEALQLTYSRTAE